MEELTFESQPRLAAGLFHSLLLREDGTVVACGDNHHGCLGLSDDEDRREFVVIPTLPRVIQVACGDGATYLRLEDGTFSACGDNAYGQLGLGDHTKRLELSYVEVGSVAIAEVICGGHHVLLLCEDGSIRGCGGNSVGQLGLAPGNYDRFVSIPTSSAVVQVACGAVHTFLRFGDGAVAAGGSNMHGQLGVTRLLHNATYRFTRVPLSLSVTQVACGDSHTFLCLEGGTLVSSGSNGRGQLGLSDEINRFQFTPVPVPSPVEQVACGNYHTFLRFRDGSLRACGANSDGQLGRCRKITAFHQFLPVPVAATVVEVDCGGYHTLLRYDSGVMASCGYDFTRCSDCFKAIVTNASE